MSFPFSPYGLPLVSDIAIPGLQPCPVAQLSPDPVYLWLSEPPSSFAPLWAQEGRAWYSSPDRLRQSGPTLEIWKHVQGGFFRFRYADGTEFLVRADGGEVAARWPARMTLEDTATYLVGPILGFVLRLRGVTCLHASAIAVGGNAILLMGGPGAGKSTAAAVLAQRGFAVVSDDISALDWRDGRPWVHPGYPRVNLWPTSVTAAFGRSDELPLITPGWEKRYVDLTQPPYQFASSALPVGAVFLLAPEHTLTGPPAIETVAPQQAVMSLVANTYANYLLEASQRGAEFETLGWLARIFSIHRIRYCPGPDSFAAVPDAILDCCRGPSPVRPVGNKAGLGGL